MKKLILFLILISTALPQSSNMLLFFDSGVTADVTAPAKPTGLAATGTVQQISLTWNANSEPDLLYYKLFYRTTDDTTAALDSATINAGTTTKDVTGLTINTVYYFWLKTQDVMGNRSYFSSVASDTAGTYKGSERIIAEIDRTQEPISVYTSNFSAGVDSWSNIWGTVSGNVDGIYGSDDVAKITANASGVYSYRQSTVTFNKKYIAEVTYFVPTASSATSLSLFAGASGGTANILLGTPADGTFTKNAWTTIKGKGGISDFENGQIRINYGGVTNGDSVYFTNVKLSNVAAWLKNGTHYADTTSAEKYAGSYSTQFVSSAAGDSTTNHISLDTLKFTELVPTDYVRLSMYVKSGTASTTMYVRIGNDTQTFALTTDWANYNYDILVNTYTVKKKIKIWFDKAATVYFDTFSLKKAL